MADPRKSAEAVRRIQEMQRSIATHQTNVDRIEREKADRVRYWDQQIRNEQDRIKQYTRQIDDLKRQI